MSGQVLITGSDGYLGRRISARLLAETDDRLILTVRASDRAELAAKEASLRRELDRIHGMAGNRIDVVAADLREKEPFGSVDPCSVTGVVHTAAHTAFNIEHSVAQEVNINGTRQLGKFARGCPKLERLLALSTLFSSGRRVGTVEEVKHSEGPGFVNHYEWSKHEAESHLLAMCADVPLSIARLATIVADDETGTVTQYNAFHNTLKLFFYGLLSLMPGDPATRLYLATADFTSRGVVQLLRSQVPAGIYHLAPAPAETVTLGETIEIVVGVFEADNRFRRRRFLRPSFCDIDSFRDLVEATQGLSVSPMAQAIRSVAPFAEQMFLPKDFNNSRLRGVWPDYPLLEPRQLVAATCTRLVHTRWGRANGRVLEETG